MFVSINFLCHLLLAAVVNFHRKEDKNPKDSPRNPNRNSSSAISSRSHEYEYSGRPNYLSNSDSYESATDSEYSNENEFDEIKSRKTFLNKILTLAAAQESHDTEDLRNVPSDEKMSQSQSQELSRKKKSDFSEINTSDNYVMNYLSNLILAASTDSYDGTDSLTKSTTNSVNFKRGYQDDDATTKGERSLDTDASTTTASIFVRRRQDIESMNPNARKRMKNSLKRKSLEFG
eukprot:CAMPEP_0113320472 /NCGR_PEP_ID=MMETSP0010_2-20120614/14282_1 /TAXON_ID=216773 ORGANISM="Corethron hystrix, Strain 308" /NCGR_SAMPLE_ID=MMETSP0010_2 /ASSEMBLY_ACC=CAM_ASM_000155 /LENGTH=232 /DNA_ID=CAMNT_0000178291 /DNA_START=131 /DNA_END=829 /DNA_ORIENTATION=+ /assembly_acc=CAM_ASM_000155